MDLELFVLECRAIILRRTSSLSIKLLFRRKMRRGSGIIYREQREGTTLLDVVGTVQRRGANTETVQRAVEAIGWRLPFPSVRLLISPQISLRRVIARLPFAASEIRGEKHAFTGVGSPKAAEQCGGPSGGTAMCRNTHRWTHREHGYGRTVGTDNTIDLRRLTALCCSSDSVVVASCAGRLPLFRLPSRIRPAFDLHPLMLGNQLFRAFTNKSGYASPRYKLFSISRVAALSGTRRARDPICACALDSGRQIMIRFPDEERNVYEYIYFVRFWTFRRSNI